MGEWRLGAKVIIYQVMFIEQSAITISDNNADLGMLKRCEAFDCKFSNNENIAVSYTSKTKSLLL